MFGIKTRIIKLAKRSVTRALKGRLVNDVAIRELMEEFIADTYGHRASIKQADLGYGWIHYSLVRTIKPGRILCIGSRHGFIPAILAQACKDNGEGHVDFVDPGYGLKDKAHWTGTGFWRTKEGKKCFVNFGLGGWITLHLKESLEFAKKNNKWFGYIYIDGDHSYQGVSLDYKLFWPRLIKYGFMVFHDIDVREKLPEGIYGVHKLWKRVGKNNAIKFPFPRSGLGILQKI